MPVLKVIFRLDFARANFGILDSPGTVMRLMTEMGENFWPEFQESQQQRLVSGASRAGGTVRQMSVEPTSLNFSFEKASGVEFGRLESNEIYGTLFKGVNSLCDHFKIYDIARAGLRFTYLGSIGDGNPSLNPAFERIIDASVFSAAQSNLGAVDDIGIKFDGSSKDKTKYHLELGPYADHEFGKYFQHQKQEGLDANLICDLDVYEEKFSLTVKPAVWARGILPKAQAAVSDIEELLLKKQGEL